MATVILRPNAAGTYQAWSTFGSPPSHWQGTSDSSDFTGVSTNNTTSKETENLADSSDLGAINSVTAYMRARASGIGEAETAAIIWRTDRTDYESSPLTITRGVFANYYEQRTTNPSTSSAWTWAEVNTLEIGARGTYIDAPPQDTIEVSEFWIVVDYTPIPTVPKGVSDSGGLEAEEVKVARPSKESATKAPSSGRTRVVEVIRVGSTDLEKDYPGKLIVRLIDRSMLYEGGPLKGLASAKAFASHGDAGIIKDVRMAQIAPDSPRAQNVKGVNLYYAVQAGMTLPEAVEDLFDRLRGKRLSGINVDCWDQISGAYLGARNTDLNGTLVLPTDTQFVEALQWKLAGGGYSDAFNGELAAGTPGLVFYFPCNETYSKSIASFPGVSGQRVNLASSWDWYDSGFFNRPAIKSGGNPNDGLLVQSADPVGFRSFQFLYYAADPVGNTYKIMDYAVPYSMGFPVYGVFQVNVDNGVLQAKAGNETDEGTTALQAGKWYLIQVNTEAVVTGISTEDQPFYTLKTDVYIGGVLEASATDQSFSAPGFGNLAQFVCNEYDGLDEIRHLDRAIYPDEISNYSTFLKAGRVQKKSIGKLGSPGW